MMEAIHSSETLVLTRATRRKIPEDGIFRKKFVAKLGPVSLPPPVHNKSCLNLRFSGEKPASHSLRYDIVINFI
jgi:hypothetical protein